MFDRKASVNLYIFSSKLNCDGIYIEKIFSLVWLLIFREEIFTSIFFTLVSSSSLGLLLSKGKSKSFSKYLKPPPRGTAGITPLSLRLMFGRICWNFPSRKTAPDVRHLSSLMSILAQSHQDSKSCTRP